MKKLAILIATALLTIVAVDAQAQRYFKGYECTQDCAGHEAGYEWAEKKDITDPDDCGGNSESFIEGCKAYAEEQEEEAEE